MPIIHQYYYRKGKATAKAVIYIIVSVLLVALAVFCYIRWDLWFMFTEWRGYVIIVPYFLITLGIILSVFENIKKASMTSRGIPAFAVGDDNFVFYDKDKGLANVVLFEDCDCVRIKRTYSRISGTQLTLIIKYHDSMHNPGTFQVALGELDSPGQEIEKQLKKIYGGFYKLRKR